MLITLRVFIINPPDLVGIQHQYGPTIQPSFISYWLVYDGQRNYSVLSSCAQHREIWHPTTLRVFIIDPPDLVGILPTSCSIIICFIISKPSERCQSYGLSCPPRYLLKGNNFNSQWIELIWRGCIYYKGYECNKSPEQRLNLSRSWHKGHSHAYNTSFFI
jgi:hypothetical protein